jgi:outer membrane receptor protein involved in Fe transport
MSSLLAPLVLTLGVGTSLHQGPQVLEDANASFKVTAGVEKVYLWGTYDTNTSGLLAQPFSNNEVMGFGIGARKSWGDFTGFLELGYASVDQEVSDRIQQEVVYTQVVRNHNVHGRPVPVDITGPYDQESYTTEYTIDSDVMGRVGVSYEFAESWSVSAAYRYFQPETYYNIIDTDWQERTGSEGYWEENTKTDMNAVEVLVEWRWD